MRHPFSFGAFVVVAVLLLSGASQAKRLTNYEIFSAQVDTLVKSITKVLVERQIKSVYCKTGPQEVDAFVRQRVLEGLLRNNFRLAADSVSVSSLRVAVPLVEVSYSAPVASHIFGSSDVIRTIRCAYDVVIADSSQIRFANSYSYVFMDTVKESEIPQLEAGAYGFLHGKIDSGSFFNTMFQPLLFIASAAVVVYLFFSLRGA